MAESITIRFLRTVRQAITTHDMLGGTDPAILVGVSGGPDSMALLHVLRTLVGDGIRRMGIAHLNHGLRPGAAEDDAAFVRRTASALGLPFFSETEDVRGYGRAHGLSIEEAARNLRYRFFEKIAASHGFTRVALGHHADDNAELVLLNLLRGSGPAGFGGIPPRRVLQPADGVGEEILLIRPLIRCPRSDIRAYLGENRIPSVTDATNSDPRYRRNRIRRELIPLLREHYNPNIVDTINRSAEIVRAENRWMEDRIAPLFREAILSATGSRIELAIPRISGHPPAVRRRLLREAVRAVKGNLRRINLRHIDAVLGLTEGGLPSGRLDLPDRIRAERTGDRLLIFKSERPLRKLPGLSGPPAPAPFEYTLEKPGRLLVPELAIGVRADILPPGASSNVRNTGHCMAFFDMETVTFPLTIRNVKPGDRFTPMGMAGSQKVKKYFIDHKVPAARRARCPILESQGKVVWLMGYRMDDSAKLTAATRKALRVEFWLA